MKIRTLALSAAVAAVSSQASAGVPKFLDARAFAMGGVGVTSARPAAASFYNPALLAIKQQEKSDSYGMLLPSVNVTAMDEDDLIDAADEFEDNFLTPFEEAVDDFDIGNLAASNAELARQATRLDDELNRINNDQALIELGAGVSFQIPSEEIGMGLFISTTARVAASLQYRDQELLETIIATAGGGGFVDPDDIPYDLDANDLQSTVRGVAAASAQAGVSLASNVELGEYDVALGVSPKIVDFRAYDFSYDADNFDDFDSDDLKDTKVSENGFNLDLGAATFLDRDRIWLAGLSIINLLPMDLTTNATEIDASTNSPEEIDIAGKKIELKPVATAGISYHGSQYVIAADLEITETKAILNEDDTQFMGIGAEYDFADTFQVRAGARHNLAGSGNTMLTAGFGLNVFGATLELAAATDTGSDSVGAAFQLGASF